MYRKICMCALLSMSLISCGRQDKPRVISNDKDRINVERQDRESGERHDRVSGERSDNDNTGKNVRDRDSRVLTPMDQSESEGDRRITQEIRKALMSDSSLSTDAKNIKIITINSFVTLRGPVVTTMEKEAILRKVGSVQGIKKVDDQLEITNNR